MFAECQSFGITPESRELWNRVLKKGDIMHNYVGCLFEYSSMYLIWFTSLHWKKSQISWYKKQQEIYRKFQMTFTRLKL